MNENLSKWVFAARHPHFVVRKLRGRSVTEASLDEIARYIPSEPVILEAGACDGTDTERFARRWPNGEIHAFEPLPDAFAKVLRRVRDLPNVRTYEVALSDTTGSSEIHLSEGLAGEDRPDASSLLSPTGHLDHWPSIKFRRNVVVATTTLDDWAVEHDVSHIDLMWLDLQGMELQALRASPQLLSQTRAVYLEIWRQEMYAGAPLYGEVVNWMTAQGLGLVIDRVPRVSGNALFVRN